MIVVITAKPDGKLSLHAFYLVRQGIRSRITRFPERFSHIELRMALAPGKEIPYNLTYPEIAF